MPDYRFRVPCWCVRARRSVREAFEISAFVKRGINDPYLNICIDAGDVLRLKSREDGEVIIILHVLSTLHARTGRRVDMYVESMHVC